LYKGTDEDRVRYQLSVKQKPAASPFDVPGIGSDATTEDVLQAVRESRAD
jgi:hypothetical protein